MSTTVSAFFNHQSGRPYMSLLDGSWPFTSINGDGETSNDPIYVPSGPDDVIIMEARNVPDAGTIGDIFALRALRRGATGVVTDGALRDTPSIRQLDLPVYHRSSHASRWSRHHMPLACNVPIACAGVTIMPGDVLVGDAEGVAVIPPTIVGEVAEACAAQELRDIIVDRGHGKGVLVPAEAVDRVVQVRFCVRAPFSSRHQAQLTGSLNDPLALLAVAHQIGLDQVRPVLVPIGL